MQSAVTEYARITGRPADLEDRAIVLAMRFAPRTMNSRVSARMFERVW